MTDSLKFKIAPHLVQDLGFNLYTSLPKVLVEFIANAYDADSPYAKISMDLDAITNARKEVKQRWNIEKIQAELESRQPPLLENQALPENISIVIEDAGHGMTRQDLQEKFLFAGRRRRHETGGMRSPKGRVVMGRKGLGKLAGFGIAHLVTVETRAAGETHATRITLDFEKILAAKDTSEIDISDQCIEDGAGLDPHGTRITLSRLLHEPMGSRLETIENAVGDHFAIIDKSDFAVTICEKPIEPTRRSFAFAWPRTDLETDCMVEGDLSVDEDRKIVFQYRLRFTGDTQALPARERGVRVYAHGRLAAAPSLLDADTNMHGFRMTDYLDGVVYADFIDEEPTDYIATDRQDLRWEAPLLAPLRSFLSDEIKKSCAECQKFRDERKEDEVAADAFTKSRIEEAGMNRREEKVAFRIAKALATLHKQGLADPGYKTQLSEVLSGFSRGGLFRTLSMLASTDKPELNAIVAEVARLTSEELEGFMRFVQGRLDGIEALKKIVRTVDFKMGKDERTIQKLFEKNPWIIEPTYSQFLSANESTDTLFSRLADHLSIAQYAKDDVASKKKRPDLVFLIGSSSLQRLVIVELKAANIHLEYDHLYQLEVYMERAESWLNAHQGESHFKVTGELIGTMPEPVQKGEGHIMLRRKISEAGVNTLWRVRDYLTVLDETESAHRELLTSLNKSADI